MTIQGLPVPVSSAQTFTGPLAVVPGTTVFTITATDASGNTATARYEVDVSDAPTTFTYDANGNLTSDGTRSFEWDARNQLVAVNVGTLRSEFTYDGLQRRVRQVEKENGVTTSDARVLWCETAICEERAADGVTVTRRAFGLGEQVNGTARFFTTDHLGSVREVTDGTGALLARYAFDPWGRRTVTAGTDVTTVGFTGHRTHTSAGLALALYRGYDAGLGRWVSEDPIGVSDGPNLFSYVRSGPISQVDPLGLFLKRTGPGVGIEGCEYYKKQCEKSSCGGESHDDYVCGAYECCRQFGEDPVKNCARRCLIEKDQICTKMSGGNRWACRMYYHMVCYNECGLIPYAHKNWTIPIKCIKTGLGM
ncbi:MAG: hypothetical protein KJ061_19480 [Vicinamibacteraceae bacterium]|nr:hypothetical protein [Vicinamibacteraceae bacterium]